MRAILRSDPPTRKAAEHEQDVAALRAVRGARGTGSEACHRQRLSVDRGVDESGGVHGSSLLLLVGCLLSFGSGAQMHARCAAIQ